MRRAVGLPRVDPRVERGRLYLNEYEWQEDVCSDGVHEVTACHCSDYHRLVLDTYAVYDPARHLYPDVLLRPADAVQLVRLYLPRILTGHQLFRAAAWQPFKVIFRPDPAGHGVYYMNFSLMLWAQARAYGRRAPWELLKRPAGSRRAKGVA